MQQRQQQKWEYLVVILSDNKHIAEVWHNGAKVVIPHKPTFGHAEMSGYLGMLGAQGWEMVGQAYLGNLIFKRPL